MEIVSDFGQNIIAYISAIITIVIIVFIFAKCDNKYNILQKIAEKINKPVIEKIDAIDGRMDTLEGNQNQMNLDLLGLKIVQENFPDEIRYSASKKYLEAKGNSGIDVLASDFIEKYKKEHKLRD